MRCPLVLLVVITVGLGLVAVSCGASGESAGPDSTTSAPSVENDSTTSGPSVENDSTTSEPSVEDDSTTSEPWVEHEVTFPFSTDELHGVLTLPPGDGPFPAIVLITGSVSTSTGLRDGASSRVLAGFAHAIVEDGYAVLRYDPPGVGRSTGDPTVETMSARASEAIAALHHLQSRTDIVSDAVGLWGASQGSWVISLAAAEHPADVAFIISVSGAGISVAEQQVWGIETQTRAAGLGDDEIAKAVVMGQLLVDWQLIDPIFRSATETGIAALGPGPWADFADIIYRTNAPSPDLESVIEILESVQDEPWTGALFLTELYLPRLRAATPAMVADLGEALAASLLSDPEDYMTRVECPVLAFFGELDEVQPSETSARLFEDYLTRAGNDDYTVVTIPDVGHHIDWTTTGYSDVLSAWLGERAPG